MSKEENCSRFKTILTVSLMSLTLVAFGQKKETANLEVGYQQLHSESLDSQQGLFADGIKLKMDLTVLEDARKEEFDTREVPADELYGGLWNNSFVNAYGALKNQPDSFKVDLSNFTMPFEGRMTSNFGTRGRYRYHYGVDIKLQTGDTVYAAFDGKIRVKKFQRGGYGYYIVMRHVNGLETVYGHLSKFLVEEDQFVKSGDPIALGGNTGRSTGSHLHFETRFLGKPINPNFIVDFENFVCHRDDYLITRTSFHKTTQSSRVLVAQSKYKEPASVAVAKADDNKFTNGSVKYYKIKSGDTLGAIAKRNGTTVTQLCRLNNITARTTLRIGRSIRIS